LCNAAVSAAINRGNDRIEEDDILAGELAYSQFAFESLLVENGITISQLKQVLFEFLGESATVSRGQVERLIVNAGVESELTGKIIARLREVSFLGVETADKRFEYPISGHPMERVDVLARKLVDQRRKEPRYAIHPAYRAYLEVNESVI
jgi:hypothetical protein